MKKYTLNFGQFRQFDKKFITSENGINIEGVSSVAFLGETLYIAADGELFEYNEGKVKKLSGKADKLFSRGGKVYVSCGHSLGELKGGKIKKLADFNSRVIDVSVALDRSIWLITEKDLYLYDGESFRQTVGIPEDTVCLAAKDNPSKYCETVYIGCTEEGLLSMKGKRRHFAEITPDMSGVLSKKVNCLALDGMGHLWVGTDEGLNIYDGRNFWFNGNDFYSVPAGSFNDMYFTADGKKYFATNTGIVTLIEGKISYFSYGAWLMHPVVKKIAVSENGTVAAVTPRGISIITSRLMTLREKAEHFDGMAVKYFTRNEGYQVSRVLRKYGDLDSGWLPNSDNDGLFTGLYCASQCFRYKVTGEEEAKKNAKRAVEAMIKLTEVTGKKGFTARATRYSHEENFGTGNREEWHYCENNPDCEWLGETSSDEMTGHYFAYGIYFDLVADKKEKKKIAEVVRTITDHIIDNNFHLTDVDGVPTTWANWEPDLLNNDDRWYYERGTNSLEILSFLKTTYHVTGDEKYNKVYEMLIKKHHYAMNCMQYKVEDAHLAHIDDQLDFTNIYPLITYTEDNAHREIFKMGLTHHFDYERVERSPMFNVIYGALTENYCDIENAARSLSEMNLDLVRWPVYNSHRKDLIWDYEPEEMGCPPQLKYPVEYSARVLVHYDGNQMVCDSGAEEFIEINSKTVNRTSTLPGTAGANGMRAEQPYIYLLPYWMARYYGLIGD
ncbi:MAG: hypothetical protein E7535_09475 [Ruminococcaceae bacterium]|nr:hypothetical protein [Oscillospiraceae bacterium]